MFVFILYPEKRFIPVETLSGWYHDAVANGDIDPAYIGFTNDEWQGQAMALSDAGLVTMGHGNPYGAQ